MAATVTAGAKIRSFNHSSIVKSEFIRRRQPITSFLSFTPISTFTSSFATTHYSLSPSRRFSKPSSPFFCKCISAAPSNTHYEFTDGSSEIELRLALTGEEIPSPKDVFVDADGTSLRVAVLRNGSIVTLMETNQLFDRVKPSETIWYIDDDEIVINLKKHDPGLKWPDIIESWESLSSSAKQLLKGTSVFIVGDSTEVNQRVVRELAVGLGYAPLDTKELLESLAKQTIDSWILSEGFDSVAEAEGSVLESLSSNARAVVSTLGGKCGAAGRTSMWQHLHAGFTVWISQTEAMDEDTAQEEARRNMQDSSSGYSKADVVVKLQGWDPDHAKSVAQASLSALKRLILSDKELPGKKSLYVRLGCRGDWPDIKPPGWNPATGGEPAF
ncbi:Probable inactive shikimate kinase like 2, chloroplastic [Linum perenne]